MDHPHWRLSPVLGDIGGCFARRADGGFMNERGRWPMRSISSFLALGDSFTEGLDDWRSDGTPRGWAARVPEQAGAPRPGFCYANLAVRGKLLHQIGEDQLPAAVRLGPGHINVLAGGTDSR